jgi:hypothetical protein
MYLEDLILYALLILLAGFLLYLQLTGCGGPTPMGEVLNNISF